MLSVFAVWFWAFFTRALAVQNYSGDGTFYSLGGQVGACGYESASPLGAPSYQQLPFANGVDTFVALNAPEYANTSSCGQCLVYQGTGEGLGTTPIPPSPQHGFVADVCPECKPSDLDLNRGGDGRWKITWTPVQCDVRNSDFQFAYEGSNDYYLKVRVLNARLPTRALSVELDSRWRDMAPTQDNAFLLTEGGPFRYPLRVRLTSVAGDTVTDTLASPPPATAQGISQYPARPDMATVGPPAGANIESSVQGSVQTCNVTLEAWSACGGINVLAGDAQIPGSCCPDGFSCVRQNAYYHQCVPPSALSPTTSPALGSSALGSNGSTPGGSGATTPLLCQLVRELVHSSLAACV